MAKRWTRFERRRPISSSCLFFALFHFGSCFTRFSRETPCFTPYLGGRVSAPLAMKREPLVSQKQRNEKQKETVSHWNSSRNIIFFRWPMHDRKKGYLRNRRKYRESSKMASGCGRTPLQLCAWHTRRNFVTKCGKIWSLFGFGWKWNKFLFCFSRISKRNHLFPLQQVNSCFFAVHYWSPCFCFCFLS